MVASRKKLKAQADAGAVSEEDLQTLLAARRSKERKTKVSKRKEQEQEKDAAEDGEENVDAKASNGKKKKKQPKNANEPEALDLEADIPKAKKQKKRRREPLEHKSPEPAQQNGADETETKGEVQETEGGNGVKTSKKKKKGNKKAKDRWGAQVIEASPPDVQDEDNGNVVQDEDLGNVNQVEEQYEPKKIYVGGMPYTTTEDDIHNYFAECGAIEELDCTIFPDTGKFRGLAFITFKTEAAARKALELDGADMGGRFLTIQKCKVKPQESTKPKVYSEPPPKTEGCTSVYIGNLSWDITQEDLKRFFKKCKIKEIRLALDKESGEFKGYGHVDFEDEASLERAVKLDQKQVLGRPIKIAYAVPKKKPDNSAPRQQDSKPGKSKSCFSCGEEGHVSFNCPKKVQA